LEIVRKALSNLSVAKPEKAEAPREAMKFEKRLKKQMMLKLKNRKFEKFEGWKKQNPSKSFKDYYAEGVKRL
jgi:hypothetical protein